MGRPALARPALSGLFHEFSYPGHFLECPASTVQPLRPGRPPSNLDSNRVSCNRGGDAALDGVRAKLRPFSDRVGGFLVESLDVGLDALRKLAVRVRARPPPQKCEPRRTVRHRAPHHTRAGTLCGSICALRIQYALEHYRHCPCPARFGHRADHPVVQAPEPTWLRVPFVI